MQKNLYLYSGVIVKINNYLPTRHQKYHKSALQLLAAVTFALLLPHVNAAEVTKKIMLKTGVDYDSNPSMADGKKDPVYIFSLVPQFQLDVNDEVNRWFLDTSLFVQRFSNEKILVNRTDPLIIVGWDRTYESGLFGIKAEYQESSARVTELKETGIFTNIDNTQKTKILAAKWQHAINPRWAVLTEGNYNDITYSVPGILNAYTLGEIRSQLSYANSEKLETFAQISFSQLRPDSIIENTNLTRLLMGANYQVSQSLSLSPRAGIYSLNGRQSDTDWLAGIKAESTIERAIYSAELGRDLFASGVGGFRKADSLKVAWQFNASERDQIGVEYQLNKYKKDASIFVDRLKSQQIIAFYDRILTDHWKARLSAARKELDSPTTNSQGNVIGVSLVFDTLSF